MTDLLFSFIFVGLLPFFVLNMCPFVSVACFNLLFSLYFFFSLFCNSFVGPPSLVRLQELLFRSCCCHLLELLFSLDLLFSLHSWGPLPMFVLNICHFCVCHLLDLLFFLDYLVSYFFLYFREAPFPCPSSRLVIVAAVTCLICYFRYFR